MICMYYDNNKKFGPLQFYSGYGKFYLNSQKGFTLKIINAQTGCDNVKKNFFNFASHHATQYTFFIILIFCQNISLPITPNWLSQTIPMSKYFSWSRPLRHNKVQLYVHVGLTIGSQRYSWFK